jgi:shikimate kinase
VCWRRIAAAGIHRPLAPEMQQAARLYDQRRPLYSLADLRLRADDRPDPNELARQVASALKVQ